MFEYHAWASILPSYKEDDSLEDSLEDYFDAIEQEIIFEISKISLDNFESGTRYMNGTLSCWFMGYANHMPSEWYEIINFFEKLAIKAPGSYGIIYWKDDEMIGKNNEFQVKVLKKGQIYNCQDIFLSPCVPEIEEL